MADSFQFKLITPTGIVLEGPAEEVVAVSPLGEFGVRAEHTDFITSLIPGLLRVKISPERAADYVVTGGLAAVRGGAMTLLAPEVQSPESLDRAATADEIRSAEEQLGRVSFYAAEYADAERALQLARARHSAAELKRPPR